MVSIFITAFVLALAILLVSGIGLYFWQKTARHDAERILPPSPEFHGLFGNQPTQAEMKAQADIERNALAASTLLERAQAGDNSALIEANANADINLYDQILNELVQLADSEAALLSLMSFVARHGCKVNGQLANAVLASWKATPDRSMTAKAFHFAALSDDANLYCQAVEQALQFWREGKLSNIPAPELRALFDGEFWILSARTRSSGAGFVLKRTLDQARRELESKGPSSPSESAGNHLEAAHPNGRAADTN